MDAWIPVFRYRGSLRNSKCPCCGFLIGMLCYEDEQDAGWPGRLVQCMRCPARFREGLEWT